MWKYRVSFGALLVCSALVHADERPDFGKLDRHILKEPVYTCPEPLYGLLVFGPKADKKIWMVLDKTKADSDIYDVLYFDRNADGDLTVSDKRLVANGPPSIFSLHELMDPATGARHTDVDVRVTGDQPTVMVSLKWRGKMKMGGGYPPDPGEYMRLSSKPETAPVVWFQGDGPFRFQRWYVGQLTIGGADDFKVFIGQMGWGRSSFCAFQEHVLPSGEGAQATLIFTDQEGKERRQVCPLKEKC
jgi:hypothetical protein